MTDAETRLWQRLRRGQLGSSKFRRQYPIAGYVVDFANLDARLIIEVDGGQHGDQAQNDRVRDQVLAARGFRVLRFWNNQVFGEMEAVLERILSELNERSGLPLPASPTSGGGEISAPRGGDEAPSPLVGRAGEGRSGAMSGSRGLPLPTSPTSGGGEIPAPRGGGEIPTPRGGDETPSPLVGRAGEGRSDAMSGSRGLPLPASPTSGGGEIPALRGGGEIPAPRGGDEAPSPLVGRAGEGRSGAMSGSRGLPLPASPTRGGGEIPTPLGGGEIPTPLGGDEAPSPLVGRAGEGSRGL
jgi:very-short-patch-repair endonuclease